MPLQLAVKHGPNTVEVELPEDASVAALQLELEQRTGLMTRKQKLIFKGKVLVGTQKLAECGVTNGAKLMLLAADGVQTQVSAPSGMAAAALHAACWSTHGARRRACRHSPA